MVDIRSVLGVVAGFNLSLMSLCPDAIYVSIQVYKVSVEKYEGRSLQRFREITPRERSYIRSVEASISPSCLPHVGALARFLARLGNGARKPNLFVLPTIKQSDWSLALHLGSLAWSLFALFRTPWCGSTFCGALARFLARFWNGARKQTLFVLPTINRSEWSLARHLGSLSWSLFSIFRTLWCGSTFCGVLARFLARFCNGARKQTLFVLPTINRSGWSLARHLGSLSWSLIAIFRARSAAALFAAKQTLFVLPTINRSG